MITRRSKRLHSKDISPRNDDVYSPIQKKRAKSPPGLDEDCEEKEKSSTNGDIIKSKRFTGKGRTRGNRQVKSSYFESPEESEESEEFEESEESDSDSIFVKSKSKRKTSITNHVQPKKKSNLQMQMANCSKADEASCSNPKVQAELNEFLVKKLSQNCRGYRSESDSSSEEVDDRASEDRTEKSIITNVDEIVQEASADSKTTEFFDFTPLLSQVTQASIPNESVEMKPEEVGHKGWDPQESAEKKPDVKIASPEKKTKRGKKIAEDRKTVETIKEQMEVFELLAEGEKIDMSAKDIKESVSKVKPEYEIPKQVEIQLDTPLLKKKKKCDDLEMALRRRLNNIRRENQVYIHKVHALCLIAHGNYINKILNSAELLACALSLLPSEKCYPPKRMNLEYLEDLISWFNKKIKLKKDPVEGIRLDIVVSLQSQFEKLEAESKLDLCFMLVCVIRALGIKCRLVINLNVAPMKPTSEQLLPITQKKEDAPKLKTVTSEKGITDESKQKNNKKNTASSDGNRKSISKNSGKKNDKSKAEDKSESKRKSLKNETKRQTSEKDSNLSRRSSRLANSKSKYFEGDESDDEKPSSRSTRRSTARKNTVKTKKDVEEELSIEEMSTSDSEGSENDFRSPRKKKLDRKVLSSEDESNLQTSDTKTNKPQYKMNYWIEVYLEAEEKWTSVDVVKKIYHCDEELYKCATHPVRYILAWNSDQTIKDVTRRYVPNYVTVTRKLRADENWWTETLFPFKPPSTALEKEEDEELEKKLEQMPLPTSINEYKNHPYYALTRHLLKFQAIYPPDAPTLGYVKAEPVYSRLCVHQLHGREMWIKEAKVVKMNETPYKIVKGRPKKEKFPGGDGPRDLELFGLWQVEDYVPPTAENGKVPRNAFGNVELFKPCMLPKGTVHLQIPGLQRIANKLNIDCAAAITGFDYSTNGWSYPVKDGFVVCEEFKDVLLDAFNQEAEEAERKEKQKREDRIYGNWRSLLKSLFIAERLKKKYNFGESSTSKCEFKEINESKK